MVDQLFISIDQLHEEVDKLRVVYYWMKLVYHCKGAGLPLIYSYINVL